jgi:feruloyl esterase
MGHKGNQTAGVEWAYDNQEAVIDFAYRATHVSALAGKAIVERYYGRKPDRSYFDGCSCGGRQALVEAERFPWDFNGVIVGAPGLNYTDIALTFARRDRLLTGRDGKPLFDAKAIEFLGSAVTAKCDMNDGLKDGQIGDPRLCHFNPLDYVCKSGATTGCLTQEQADAASAFYMEQKSASGDRVGDRAFLPGSEVSYLGMQDNPVMKRSFYEDFFKYMGLIPNPGPAWKFENFDLNSDYKRLGLIQSLLQADNPDLTKFRDAGGKLIFYHGWADGGPSPLTSIDFYQKIERTMGGRASTQNFLRLFMIPDMDHCAGGKGAWTIDFLAYLENWVEKGKAPDVMTGAHYSDDPMAHMIPNLAGTATAQFTRPVFPYPLRAQYKGTGDPNSAASFKAVNSD